PMATVVQALRPTWWPLLGKEWRTLRRDPQVWAPLLYPLFIMGFWLYRTFSQGAATGTVATGRAALLPSVGLFYGTLTFVTYFLLTFLALPLINREGRSLYLLALAPLTARDIRRAKWAFCVLPALALVEGLVVAGAVILRMPPAEALLGALAFASLVVALAGALLLVSLVWPRLDWDNPRRRVSGTATLV